MKSMSKEGGIQLTEAVNIISQELEKIGDPELQYSSLISQYLNKNQVSQLKPPVSEFQDAISSLKAAIRDSDEVDSAYADGLNDIGVTKQLDLVGGQIRSATKVQASGARCPKIAEYLDNASDAAGDAINRLNRLEEHIRNKMNAEAVRTEARRVVTVSHSLREELVPLRENLETASEALQS